MIRTFALGACLACIANNADAVQIEYFFVGTATGDVLSEDTGALIETLDDFPFDYRIISDTDAVFADGGLLVAPGTGFLSLDGSPFVEEDDTVFAVLDPIDGIVGALDIDAAGFFNNAPEPALVGYDLRSSIGPIPGLESDDFVSVEILNEVFGEPVNFEGVVTFSFEASTDPEVVPAPLPFVLLGSALVGVGLWGGTARRREA